MDEKTEDIIIKLIGDWHRHVKSWREIAAEGADEWIKERSIARSQTWENAIKELTTAFGVPCQHPGVFAKPGSTTVHCSNCETDVPVAEL